jgi:hypothetical protein
MEITNAQYARGTDGELQSVSCTIDGVTWSVPIDLDNTHYAEIMRQVNEGILTIADAD